MQTPDQPGFEARPSAPPTVMGPIPDTSSWPNVVGIISIVLGSLGILSYGCCGMIGNVAVPLMTKMAEESGQVDAIARAQLQVSQDYMVWNILVGLGATALAVSLLVAGIKLVKRQKVARRLSITWSVLRIALSIPQAMVAYFAMNDQFQALQQAEADANQPMPPGLPAIIASMGVATIFFSIAWAAAWPTFNLIWFSRQRIKSEVERW